jgi:sugar phosphate isomerase/epimerase
MKKITRRQALGAAAATVGAGLVGSLDKSAESLSSAVHASSTSSAKMKKSKPLLPNVWGEDFLTQWSPPDDLKKDLSVGSSHIRLACNSSSIMARGWRGKERPPWEEQFKAICDAGYTAAETWAWGWDEEHVKDSDIREIKQLSKEFDIEFYTIHVWANMIHPDMEERAKVHKLNVDAIAMAERLGMKWILTHTGGRDPENKDKPHPLNHTRETWKMSVEATKKILKDTSGSKINLGFEAVNSCNNNTPQSHVRLREDVGDERVKVTLDPCNMLHPGTIFRTTELLDQCFDMLGEEIMYCHAKDKVWNEMLPHFEGVALGTGLVDYETYLARMSRLKTPRVLYIEHLADELYPPSKKHLEETAKRLGVKIYGSA